MQWLERLVKWSYWPVAAVIFSALFMAAYSLLIEVETPPVYHAITQSPDLSASQATNFLSQLRSQLMVPEESTAFADQWSNLLRYPMHVEIWHQHDQIAEATSFGGETQASWRQLKTSLHFFAPEYSEIPDDATMSLAVFYQPEAFDPLLSRYESGLNQFFPAGEVGIYFRCREESSLMPPLRWMTSAEAGFQAVGLNLNWLGCGQAELETGIAETVRFNVQHWVQQKAAVSAIQWHHTDLPVPLSAVTSARLEQFLQESIDWYEAHQQPDGQLPYQYNPIVDHESDQNTMTRQWISNQALAFLAKRFPENETMQQLYRRHLDYMLNEHFHHYGGYGAFEYNNRAFASTNGIAMTSLAVAREMDERYAAYYEYLAAGLKRQFRNTHIESVIVNQREDKPDLDVNFAPGAVLIALGEGIERGWIEPISPEQLRRWFAFYYDKWQESGSLYGAPWHILAYQALMHMDPDQAPAYREAIYIIADQLVACQRGEQDDPLWVGTFHHTGCVVPNRRPGPTAMRTEGLIVAYILAKDTGDMMRSTRYRQAIKRGHRMVLQGQLREHHLFFTRNPDKARYGIRYDLYDASMRIDGIAHALISVMAGLDAGVYDDTSSLEKSRVND